MNPLVNDPQKTKSPTVGATGLFKIEIKSGRTDQSKPNPAGQSQHADLLELENETRKAMQAAGLKSAHLGYPRVVYPLREKYLKAETEFTRHRSSYGSSIFPSRVARLDALRALRDQAVKLGELKRQCEEAGV